MRLLIVHRFIALFAVFAGGNALAQPAAGSPAYDFAYHIEGDKRVAPVQVFDDGRQTYMQFRVGQLVPAIFSSDGRGEALAPLAWQGGYAVVAGTAQAFVLRIGEVEARARYRGRAPRAQMRGVEPGDFMPVEPAYAERSTVPRGTSAPARAEYRPAQAYAATPADVTMRQALKRWASAAGWTFEAEHWAVAVDIPLAGSARLGSDFKAAVRELLAATELSSQPLQPCFYSNQVLRVIPLAESCNRMAPAAVRQG